MNLIPGDIVRHYKGDKYLIISADAIHSELSEKCIVYRALYESKNKETSVKDYQVWVRPAEMFNGYVSIGLPPCRVKRFNKC